LEAVSELLRNLPNNAAGLAGRDGEAASQIRMLVDMVQKSPENVHALAAGTGVL
jgi:hypothetical protein